MKVNVVNCSKCGCFVGKDGEIDVSEVDVGVFEMFYPKCKRCLDEEERRPYEQNKGNSGEG